MAYTTIDDSGLYFNTKLYTGNGSTQTITGVGFQPDFTWVKDRDAAEAHTLQDAVRGAGERLYANLPAAQTNSAISITSWNSDGFALGAGGEVNTNTDNFVSWNWKANGAGAINEEGSLNTTKTSANTTSGVSIITYTGNGSAGATIGHGMGITPQFFVQKRLSGSGGMDWHCYHVKNGSNPQNSYVYLNTANGTQENDTANWFLNDTYPSSSLITLGNATGSNGSTVDYVIYAFADVQGFSKFSSYEGNANVDGTFVYTGFRPACVIIKNIDASDSWRMFDNKRSGYNPDNDYLYPNSNTTESIDNIMDIVSNGFKLRKTDDVNAANTYIYMAFAEAPLVNSNGVPCNAR